VVDIPALYVDLIRMLVLATGMANGKFQIIKGGRLQPIDGPYCSIQVKTNRKLGQPSRKYVPGALPDELDEIVTTSREVVFSLNFYRGGANQFADNLIGADKRAEIQAYLFGKDISWLSLGIITDLTAAWSGETEERAHVELTTMIAGDYVSQVGLADNVDIVIVDENDNIIAQGNSNDLSS